MTGQSQAGTVFPKFLLFIIPGVAVYTLFLVAPVVQASFYSFFAWNGFGAQINILALPIMKASCLTACFGKRSSTI